MAPSWTIKGGVFNPALCLQQNTGAGELLPFCLWGILNLTPDSFFDGGSWLEPASAQARALEMAASGAGILDLGPASSRPGSVEVPASTEIERLELVLDQLLAKRSGNFLISIDTWRTQTASYALGKGVEIINDISACLWEPELAEILAQYQPGYVLMHSQGRPERMQLAPSYENIVDEVLAHFDERMRHLTAKGLPEGNILLDPGIGFGKNLQHNLALLRGLDRLHSLGRPVLLGLSNKAMFKDLFGLDKNQRNCPTAVASALCASRGVIHHRVHDVALHAQAIKLVRALSPV